eukprot:TRINITY_DN3822_c0_g1_i1.p1 TRINITY_DN3822_c0_g1~~TRINITY_DN3822_c0_g1_i1.p1  ORF type:complete len:401 (+),score=92.41 TRINITY_DN3822_c0_g1_i1:168-1205(+)
MSSRVESKNHAATLFVGELDAKVNEALLWELALNCGPVASVYIPRDKLTREHNNFGFVEFQSANDAQYALRVLGGVAMFGKTLRIKPSSHSKDQTNDIGANLFVGNLDTDVQEQQLHEVFSKFGILVATPKIMRDPETNISKGFAFINFDTFEGSDAAIEGLNGQFLGGKAISVTYALMKDSKTERHGSMAERILAANNPNRRFAKMRQDALNSFGAPAPQRGRVVGGGVSGPPPTGPPPIRPPPGMIPSGMGPPPGFRPPTGPPPGYHGPPPTNGGPPPGYRPPSGPPPGYRPPAGPPTGYPPRGPPPGFQGGPPPGYFPPQQGQFNPHQPPPQFNHQGPPPGY